MRLVIQKVLNASVRVNNQLVSEIGPGILILLGICKEDNVETVDKWVRKALNCRLWTDVESEKLRYKQLFEPESVVSEQQQEEEETKEGEEVHGAKKDQLWKTNVMQNNYEVLVVSQFTLYGHLNKGNKPDFHASMGAEGAKQLYEDFLGKMRKMYNPEKVKGGAFQQYMHVSLCNDGPVTLTLDGIEEAKPAKKANNPKQPKEPKQKKQQEKKEGDQDKSKKQEVDNNKDQQEEKQEQNTKEEQKKE